MTRVEISAEVDFLILLLQLLCSVSVVYISLYPKFKHKKKPQATTTLLLQACSENANYKLRGFWHLDLVISLQHTKPKNAARECTVLPSHGVVEMPSVFQAAFRHHSQIN